MLLGEIQKNGDCGTENSEQDRKEKADNSLEKAKHAVFEIGHTIGQIALASFRLVSCWVISPTNPKKQRVTDVFKITP